MTQLSLLDCRENQVTTIPPLPATPTLSQVFFGTATHRHAVHNPRESTGTINSPFLHRCRV